MSGVLDTIRAVKRPERTVELCLRGDLVADFENLERELVEARTRDATSFTGGAGREIAERMDALREQMKAGTVTFRLRALERMRPLAFAAEHPPRDGNDADKRLGYNSETYYPALVRECCYALEQHGDTLAVSDITEEDWTTLLDGLSHKQFDRLFGAAWALNDADVAVPTSALASLISQANDESSTTPAPGTSPPNGSPGGSRRTSRKSSATKPVESFG